MHRAIREFYYELRSTRDSPFRTAAAVFAGIVIGCLPIYGLHLAGCVLVARLCRISVTKTYLAAHINNPFTAPFIVAASVVLGRLVVAGGPTEKASLAQDVLHLGRDLLVGALVLGMLLGAVAALTALFVSRRWGAPAEQVDLRERVARRFLDSSIRDWEFVRSKLRYDPVYLRLLDLGLIADEDSVVDLGCGRGILLAMLAEHSNGNAPRSLTGLERSPRAAFVARRALRGQATLCVVDLTSSTLPPGDSITLLDVLHYMPRDAQDALLRRAAAALRPGGRIVVREADQGAGWRFWNVRVAERVRACLRGDFRQSFAYRSAIEWEEVLASFDLDVQSEPIGSGTPFANVLIAAHKATETDAF